MVNDFLNIENEHSFDAEKVIRDLKTDLSGLSEDDAKTRLVQTGFNEIIAKKKASALKMFFSQFNNFLIYILIAAMAVSLLLAEWADSIVIAVVLILNALLGFIQETKAEKSIEALKKMAGLKARVLRDGQLKRIPVRELVIGDVILIETGEKVPADARIIESVNLEASESALTGESTTVSKTTESLEKETSLADRKNMLFSGTIVTSGRGKAVITKTGMSTEIGRIAKLIQETELEPTPLQEKLEALGKWLGWMIVAICIIITIIGVVRGGKIFEMILIGVSLAVAAIPEGLAAVVTICLAIGSINMAKRKAIVRRLALVETLGCTTVICTDKTGTLTCNEMTVRKIYNNSKTIEITGSGYKTEGKFLIDGKTIDPKELEFFLTIGALNNTAVLKNESLIGDPTEAALIVSARKSGINDTALNQKYPIIAEVSFSSSRKMMSTLHNIEGKKMLFSKGAPEIILDRCKFISESGGIRPITSEDRKKIIEKNIEFANQALRVLGFAYKEMPDAVDTDNIGENELVFAGLQAMIDPPRPEVKAAIKECFGAGIKVVMITGDYLITALAVAKEIGLEGKVLTGKDLDSGIDLDKVVEEIVIYARVDPEHKIKIVDALKKKGHIVAMTGDGVNDAPALKKADIGVSMGLVGTDVAREASGMVLTDDNFATIVHAIEEGRVIFDNIKKSVNYLLSCNLGEVLVLFLAMLLGMKTGAGEIIVPLTAIQILWMNLVTDGLPALALSVDPSEKNIMKRSPRDPKEKIIEKNMGISIVLLGIFVCAGVLFLFNRWLAISDPVQARTVSFTAIVVFEMFAVFMIRYQYGTPFFSNLYIFLSIFSSLVLQAVVIYLPFFNRIFKTVPLGVNAWIEILAVSAIIFVAGSVSFFFIRKLSVKKAR